MIRVSSIRSLICPSTQLDRAPEGHVGQMAETNTKERESRCGAHLLGDQVIEQGDHTYGQDLLTLLLHQAPEDLQPPELQELLLGIGEVAQQGAQCKQDLGAHTMGK